MVYDLCKSEEKLRTMRSMKKADQGLKAEWPELETHLRAWILERAENRGIINCAVAPESAHKDEISENHIVVATETPETRQSHQMLVDEVVVIEKPLMR